MEIADRAHPDPPHNTSKTEEENDTPALALMRLIPRCSTCKEMRYPIVGPGDSWAILHHHEPHCPEHEDNHAATGVQLVGLADDVLRDHAEAIWAATRDGEEE